MYIIYKNSFDGFVPYFIVATIWYHLPASFSESAFYLDNLHC